MESTFSNIKVVYSLLTNRDIEEAAICIARAFRQGEPMALALNIPEEDFIYFTRILIKKAARDGMSVVARDPQNNRLAGCIICEDYVTEPPEGIEKVSPLFNPIFSLLDALGASYRAEHFVAPGEIYHLFMGGVYPDYAGYGIAAQITNFIENHARKKGYKAAIGEVTGPVSQHIYIKQLGYRPLYKIRYQDFLYEGKTIFKNITACEHCILIHKYL